MKVFVSGCYDLLHSGHVEFFRQASLYGDLYVGIGSDETIRHYKNHEPMYPENERLFMVQSIKYVKEALINQGDGFIDFIPTLDMVRPDIFVVNSDGDSEEKRKLCQERGIEYKVLERVPHEGLTARSSTTLKANMATNSAQECQLPTRLDLAGTWIDQPYVSKHAPGWALTISLEPTFEVRERCGLSTSTRNVIKSIWPNRLPEMDAEKLARLVFCYENNPERQDGIISGAQDAIGICVPGLCRHYYNGAYWPEKIERCHDNEVLDWLESHLIMIPMPPRCGDCCVTTGMEITPTKVRALADAADRCWNAIMHKDLSAFAQSYQDSFNAQTAMFPAMIQGPVQEYIDRYKEKVLAYKMPGAGGGGYLACVVESSDNTLDTNQIKLKIRRK